MDRFVARAENLIVEELDGGVVIYDGNDAQAHWLDPDAAAVWRACDRLRTEAEVAGAAGVDGASCELALSQLVELGLVEAEADPGYSRRAVLRGAAKVGLSGAIAAPIVSTLIPAAAAHASAGPPPPPPPPPTTSNGPLTPGYWKNHQTVTTPLLSQNLGNYTVSTFSQVTAVFGGMDFAASSTQDAVGGLAGHLLAAELNVASGVTTPACASTAISQATAFLKSVNYIGPTGTYSLSKQQRATAVALGKTLDSYNRTGAC